MKKIYALLTLCLLFVQATWADLPCRNHRHDVFKVLRVNSENIVFVGNSITNMHEWWEAFGNHKILNRGNSGGLSDEVLNNIESYIAGKPAKMFLMIGTNDLGTAGINNPQYVAGKIRDIVRRVRYESPQTELYVQSILPSSVGLRTLENERATNELVKVICEEEGATYIDLWDDLIGLTSGTALSLDGLHLKATGYRIWCEKIAPLVGNSSVYLNDAATNSQTAGLSQSQGMRVSYFGGLPINDGDVLMVGDEMIHGGEWHELLHCDKIKDRGNGWSYPAINIANTTASMPVILKGRTDNGEPAKIFLYAGVANVNNTANTLESVKTAYEGLVNKTRELAPNAKIYLLSLIPKTSASDNTNRVAPFNEMIKEIATARENVEYVDIYTPLLGANNVANATYITANYLYGRGYVKVSQIIEPLLAEEHAVAITDEEANAQIELLAARTALGANLTQLLNIGIGDGVGQYPESKAQPVLDKIKEVSELLQKDNATVEELNAMAATCSEAVQSILAGINMPQASTDNAEYWYTLSTPQRGTKYLTSTGTGKGVIGEDNATYAKNQWKFVRRSDDSYDIINRKDGSFLDPTSAAYQTQIKTAATTPAQGWTLSYSNTPGLYIVSSKTVQLNQTNNTGAPIYNWSGNKDGLDRTDTGCQYLLTEFPDEPSPEPDTLEDGWYQLEVGSSASAFLTGRITDGTHHVLNAEKEYKQSATNFYALKFGAIDENKKAASFVHLRKSNSNFQFQALNGHTINTNCTSSRNQEQFPATITSDNLLIAIDKWAEYTNNGEESPYIGQSSSSNNKFKYHRVTEEELEAYDHYTVCITGDVAAAEIADDAHVVCSNASNKGIAKVYNNGHYFFPKGTAVSAVDFAPSSNSAGAATVSIESGVIYVTYGKDIVLSDVIEQAESVLALKGVGYPKAGSDARTALSDAIAAAKASGDSPTAVAPLNEAIGTYQSSTDIELPQAGKAYTLTCVEKNGTTYTMYAAADGTLTVGEANKPAAEYGAAATFVCGETADKYYFAFGSGNYLIWRGHQEGANGNKGFLTSYDENYCPFTVASGNGTSFGTVYLTGKRENTNKTGVFLITSDGVFNAWTSGIGFSDTYSNLFLMQEIEYPNVATTLPCSAADRVAAFSAPFPTVAPEGTTVYSAAIDGQSVRLTETGTTTIPANTGVILAGTAESYTLVPAKEDGTAIDGNELHATGFDAVTAPTGAFVLTAGAPDAVFAPANGSLTPNSAYIVGSDGDVASMPIVSGTTDGIGGVSASDAAAPEAVYDLSGRRVTHPAAGIYVKGGRKIFVR